MKSPRISNQALVLFALASILMLTSGCPSLPQRQKELPSSEERELRPGIVQREIRVGMSQPDVTTALGSPTIVTRDSEGKKTWIYDKIATQASYSEGGGGTALILGLLASCSDELKAALTTQKTLTVVIKFGENGLVESFSHHSSKY